MSAHPHTYLSQWLKKSKSTLIEFRWLTHDDTTDMVTSVQNTRTGVHSASPGLRPVTKNPVSHLRVNKSAIMAACAASLELEPYGLTEEEEVMRAAGAKQGTRPCKGDAVCV